MDARDSVRRRIWREASTAAKILKIKPSKGRPAKTDEGARMLKEARQTASTIKESMYPLGKAQENLTENQKAKLEVVVTTNKELKRAYELKEHLRVHLKIKDPQVAQQELKRWLWRASHSRIPEFRELYEKIKRHREHIMNAITQGVSNARIEATINKIKLIIRKAYGFRNMTNMLDMVYLVCSNLEIPLPNRKQKHEEMA